MVQFLPVIVLGLAGGTWYTVSKRAKPAGMTAARKLVFDQLINQPQETKVLLEMADVFEKNGLAAQADLLRKRSKLRDLPPETKEAHKQAFRDAMKSTDVPAILNLANAYEKQGATGNAAALRTYATNLKTAQAVTPSPQAPANPPADATTH